ncbi:oxidative stress survival, Svf1-like protein [Geopyxis carbonaria]|nr:oxidative stress survival, Svf1-like protein [Geopyxis carbonaria]
MFSWVSKTVQSGLSTVAGTAEPIYGPEALHSVATQEDQNPTYESPPEDLHWLTPESTSAETQTFYLEADSGYYGIVQVIYSNVANLHVTAQFNVKVFYPDGTVLWSPKSLLNYEFDEKKRDFYAEDFSITMTEDNQSYIIKSAVDPEAMVDLKITRTAPAFKVGKDGRTNYGTDPTNPWGCIRHIFWPRSKVQGIIVAKDTKLDFTGKAMFVMALQGMKPHHAAARWNFFNFQSPTVSATMMEFITPESYGNTVVNVCGIVKDEKLVLVSTEGKSEHTETKFDELSQWNEPTALKYTWKGKSLDGKDVEATVEGPLEKRLDRVDFMAELPAILKNVIAGAVGTRPYIYQYSQKMNMKLKIGEEESEIEGKVFAEATFIS